MTSVITAVLVAAGIVLLVPSTVLLIEVLAGLLPARRRASEISGFRPRMAVLVPAHDEALVIADTLRGIRRQLSPNDRLVVIADNCTDNTAQIAETAGAEVVRRQDATLRGKSYALDFGMHHLAQSPPDVVIIVDADCGLDPGCLETIATAAFFSGRPVQAHYELLSPDGVSSPRLGIAVFAAKVKNFLRPLGLDRLGLPCQLMGTGMAFPWRVISQMDLKSGELTEDLVLGLDLARAGAAPVFSPTARVTSAFPMSAEGTKTQRARWETGHLTTIFYRVPGQLWDALRHGNWRLMALAMDAAVPPLALHALLLTALFSLSLIAAVTFGTLAPLALSATAAALFGLSIALAWVKVGREAVSMTELAKAPIYVLLKIPLYVQILSGKHISWIRSKRD